jgi:S-formylglutathione hydrolase FrmB
VFLLRTVLAVVLGLCLWTAAQAKAAAFDYLMVPSAAMGRDIPVAFMSGGPHAVYLLDAFNAGESISNWVTAGNAMTTLAGAGVSVVAPAGGAYSLYTDWEQDGSRQWETFLSNELPNWLAANKGLAPGGHAIVGASQGGTAALTTLGCGFSARAHSCAAIRRRCWAIVTRRRAATVASTTIIEAWVVITGTSIFRRPAITTGQPGPNNSRRCRQI